MKLIEIMFSLETKFTRFFFSHKDCSESNVDRDKDVAEDPHGRAASAGDTAREEKGYDRLNLKIQNQCHCIILASYDHVFHTVSSNREGCRN